MLSLLLHSPKLHHLLSNQPILRDILFSLQVVVSYLGFSMLLLAKGIFLFLELLSFFISPFLFLFLFLFPFIFLFLYPCAWTKYISSNININLLTASSSSIIMNSSYLDFEKEVDISKKIRFN